MVSGKNRVIGYILAEGDVVLGPPGKAVDVLFGSRSRAEEAAAEWGLAEGGYDVHELWYQGLLGMTLNDTGDVLMDGMAARRLSESCQQEGRFVHWDEVGRIDMTEKQCIYSSRLMILGVSEISQMAD